MPTPAPWSEETVELFEVACMIWRHRGDARLAVLTGLESVRKDAIAGKDRIREFPVKYPAAREARRRYLDEGEVTLIP